MTPAVLSALLMHPAPLAPALAGLPATFTPSTTAVGGNVYLTAAVGLLLEKQRLNLDADIQVYVPEFPEKQWPVNLRQLMGNLAGVRNDAGDEESLEPCERTLDGLKHSTAASAASLRSYCR